jgi:uncharacterized protein involved in response to NO
MTISTIDEAGAPRAKSRDVPSRFSDLPVWRLGFRPFYLLAAIFAALGIPLWMARYNGVLSGFPAIGLYWHLHEMVFGFAVTVVIGFLYTAARNWTGEWTPRGAHLAALAAVWLAGRLAMLFAPPLAAALIDIAFLPLAAWPFYRVLHKAGNKRNAFLAGLLSLLALANLAFHAAVLNLFAVRPVAAVEAAILIIVVIESVIGSRIIPGFTANAVPGVKPRLHERRDRICMGLTVAACAAWIIGLPAPALAGFALAAAAAQVVRMAGWNGHRTLHNPLLWILHLSYAWIPAGFLLLALAAMQVVSTSAAFHAFTVGSMGGLIIGMITRTALGHTGRRLHAGLAETAMYILAQAGALARLHAALWMGETRPAALMASALCWSAAFGLYVMVYGPYLMRARIDGKEG